MADEAQTNKKNAGSKSDLNENQKEVLELIEKMNIVELADLVKAMEEKFGISATAPVAVASAQSSNGQSQEKQEEKSTYNVVLKSAGDKKIQVIKAIREITDLGLKEAKDLAEAGGTVNENVKTEEAKEQKKKLESAGATVELQ